MMKNLKYILYCSGLALLLASCDTENIVRDAEIELAKPMKKMNRAICMMSHFCLKNTLRFLNDVSSHFNIHCQYSCIV